MLLAFLPLSGRAAVTVDGPDDLVALIRPHLPEEATEHRLRGMIEEMLATEGYFSPTLLFSGSADALHIQITPGERTHIVSVDLRFAGPLDEATRQRLSDAWRLPVGRPFRQDDWSEAKQQTLGELLSEVYADARIVDSAAEIDAEAHTADLQAHYDAGSPYRFGAIHSSGLYRYSDALIARYNRAVKPGHPYRQKDLAALQSTLQATPYFASARVSLERDAATRNEDGSLTAPVAIDVRERPAHRVSFGTGASSNTGARVEASYHTPNLFGQAWALDSAIRIEQKQQTAFADVMLPPDSGNRRYAFGTMYEATDIEGLRTRRHAVGAQIIQPRGSIEQRLSLTWQRELQRPDGAEHTTSSALVPNALWIWRHVDNVLDPRRGTVLQAQIGGGSKAFLSDQNFLRLHARGLQYIPLGANDTLTLRADLGATLAPSRQGIPQEYLFRAGGTGSVRGYDYQSLGVREGSAIVGGRFLTTASIEATHWFTPAWGGAAFVDTGAAADRTTDLSLSTGYGFGVRWKSPAGPIGVDLAYGQRSRELHLHFALAIPF